MRLRLATLALLLAPAAALAQGPQDYGSIYSRYALGQRFDGSTSQASMMGISGVAMRSGLYNGLANPALGADQTLVTFSAEAAVRGVRATDADGLTADATAADLAMIQLGVPLYSGRLGLTASYRPYTRVDYRAVSDGELRTDTDTLSYRVNLEGAGGLQRIALGAGGRLSKNLSVGASAEALVGTIEYLQRTEFPDGGAAFGETREARATRLYGFTSTLGATATLPSLASETDLLTVGAAMTLPTTLRGSRATTLGTSLDRDTLATEADGNVRLPLTAQGGIAYSTGERLAVSADVLYEPWSEFESDFTFGGFAADGSLDDLRNRLRVGGGVEVIPGGNRRGAGYWARTAYRLGAYTDRGLAAPQGTDISAYALTGGVSMPTRFPGTRVDLGFEVGTRGQADGIYVRDLFWRGTFTLNFGDRWFVRRRLG